MRYHISGQAVVTIDGKDYYLGKHGSAEALARYAVLIAEYQAGNLTLPPEFDQEALYARARALIETPESLVKQHQADQPILVRHVTAAYREFIKVRYAHSQAELQRFGQVCDELDEHDGDKLASEYGPKAGPIRF